MPRRLFTVIASVLLLPATCFALAMCERGNRPQSAKNYEKWPGLIDVINDPSRVALFWVNGDERMSFRGDTTALNRLLKEFSEVEAEERRLVLLPGPGRLSLIGKTAEEAATDPEGNSADYELHVIQGLVRGHAQHIHAESIYDMHPTLTVYVTDRIDLHELEIPGNIKVLQHSDRRRRFEVAIALGNVDLRNRAKRMLEYFDSQMPKDGPTADEYQSQLDAIAEFVKQHNATQPAE